MAADSKEDTYEESAIRDHYRAITRTLIEKGLTITTMESITGGQIASLLTDTEGASAILKGAFVTYSNEAKIRQGVPAEVIATYGVYSKETARAMAVACKDAYAADIGIGITGTTGNTDPKNPDSVPGQVYASITYKNQTTDLYFEMEEQPSRLAYKFYAAEQVAQALDAI